MFLDIISQVPPVTKIQILISITLTFLVYSETISKYDLYYNFDRIFYKLQIWRLITSVYYSGQINILYIVRIILFCQISIKLQKSGFKRGSIDYLYFLILTFIPLYAIATIFKIYSLNDIFYLIMYYIYGRKNRNDIMLVNFMPIRAPYFIWSIIFIHWIIKKSDMKEYIISIFISHSYYFFSNVYPKLTFSNKVNLTDPPESFVRFFSRYFERANNIIPQMHQQDNQNLLN